MFKNKIQKRQEDKRSVISFDTLTDNGNDIEVLSLYNAYNGLYEHEPFVEKQSNMTPLDVINRRMCLEGIFKNRIVFLLDNAISEFTSTVNCSCPDIINEYPFIFDIHSYMADITNHTVLDYTNLICSALYNQAMAGSRSTDKLCLEDYADSVMLILKSTLVNIYNSLYTVSLEARGMYFNAGLPGLVISDEE